MPEVFVPRLAIDTAPLITRELYVSGDGVDWSKIPGIHTSYFLHSLAKHVYSGMDWALEEDVIVRKLKGDAFHPVIISKKDAQEGDNQLKVWLNEDMSKAILAIDGKRHIELPVRIENGKIIVHGINSLQTDTSFQENKMNRLLYWGDLKLFDYIADPLHKDSCEE